MNEVTTPTIPETLDILDERELCVTSCISSLHFFLRFVLPVSGIDA
jgi:hypothetical protein